MDGIGIQQKLISPRLASLKLQPGGVVSAIVPQAGNERAIGFNVLKDPARPSP
jgi:hypothetical protein